MIGSHIKAGATALVLGSTAAGAAPINLAGLGFQEGTPSYSGSGGVFFDAGTGLLSADLFNPIVLQDFPGSDLTFFFDALGPNIVDVFYQPGFGDFELFTITASGDNGSDTLEFLLARDSFDLSNGTAGVGLNAILRITSSDFNFAGADPLDFFDANAVNVLGFFEYVADVDVTLTALEPTTPIPLPASALLLVFALGGLGAVSCKHRRA